MRCANCGKEIAFGGRVCPWCHTNNAESQRYAICSTLVGGFGAWIGWNCGDGFSAVIGLVVGAFIGGVVGGIVAAVWHNKQG